MARCKTCTFAAHTGEWSFLVSPWLKAGCYGISSQEMGADWECELCANVRLEETNLVRIIPGGEAMLTQRNPIACFARKI